MASEYDHIEVTVSRLPECDICNSEGWTKRDAVYDGKTIFGPWANMCQQHYEAYGVGLGLGRGQRLVVRNAAQEST